jgi:type IX secretion system PorP/SprF family membrane protein
MNILRWVSFVIIFITAHTAYAQDPNFSNFVNNKIYYNPAYTGIDYGLRIKMAYRQQWINMPDQFQTYYVCAAQSVRCFSGAGGFGLMAISNTEGAGALRTITVGVPLSSRIPMGSNSVLMMSWMPAFEYFSINWDQFIFSGQLNPYYGNVNPSTFIPPDNGSSSKISPDIANFGFVYRYETKLTQSNSLKFYRKFEVGLSGYHFNLFNEPVNQSLTHGTAPLYSKIVFLTSYNRSLPLGYDGYILIEPSLLYEFQGKLFSQGIKMRSVMIGCDLFLTDYNIEIGAWYRSRNTSLQNTDAVIAMVGYNYILDEKKNIVLSASLAYDFTVSKLADATRGSPEISLSITFNKSSLCSDRSDPCDEGSPFMNRKKLSVKSYH